MASRFSRRLVLGGWLSSITSPAWARFLTHSLGGGRAVTLPTITGGPLVSGSSVVASGTANVPDADFGIITTTTSDSSVPTLSITGANLQGYRIASSHLRANLSTGASPGTTMDVNIVASGAYSNSPQSITPTITASGGSQTPVAVNYSPASPVAVLDNITTSTVISTVSVTTSDSLPFGGTLTLSADAGGRVVLSGNNIMPAHNFTSGDIGSALTVTVRATESAVNVSGNLTLSVLASGGSLLAVNTLGVRPRGSRLGFDNSTGNPNGFACRFDFSYLTATITGGPANVNDRLVWAPPGSGSGTFVDSPIYLNGTTTPPGSGISNAQFMMPAVSAFQWNPTQSWSSLQQYPTTTPFTSWELRFIRGSDNSVAAAIPITVDILKRPNPYFQAIGPVQVLPIITGGAPLLYDSGSCSVLGGVMTAHMPYFSGGDFLPPVANSVTLQYTIDDIPVGAPVVGPPIGGVAYDYPISIDTTSVSWNSGTGIPDGTHALGCRLVDCTSGGKLPYQFRQGQRPFIVHNGGGSVDSFYSGPRLIPLVDPPFGAAPGYRFKSLSVDFVQFPGLSALPLHATSTPVPSPQAGFIPPVSSVSSPFHGHETDLLFSTNFYNEALCGSPPSEYQYQQRFLTTPAGGVFAYPEYPEASQDLNDNYGKMITVQIADGERNDGGVSDIASLVEGRDHITGNAFWTVFEENGRIARLEYTGKCSTLCGFQYNRNVLPFADWQTTANAESVLNTRYNVVGTIGSPSFGDMRGMNDGAYDPSDATFNTLYVAVTTGHFIAKVTNLQSGSPTMVRYCGQDGGLGGQPFGPFDGSSRFPQISLNGGYIDGPVTEFISGAQVAHFVGHIDGSGVLTVESGYTVDSMGGLQAGCPLSWSGNLNTTTGNMVISNIAGSGNGSTWQTNAASQSSVAMTASQQVALLNTPYSVQVSGGPPDYTDPAGTIYIIELGNSTLRKIDPSTHMVSTVFGNQDNINLMGYGLGQVSPVYNISALLTWSGGLMRVQVSAPITINTGFRQSYSIAPHWTVDITGTGNPNIDNGQSPAGKAFEVVSVATPQDFMVAVPVNPGTLSATGQVTVYLQDIFAPMDPGIRAWNRGAAGEAFCTWPESMRWSGVNPGGGSATRHLVIGCTWTFAVLDVDLTAQTVRTIGALYNPIAPPYDLGIGIVTVAHCRTARNIRGGGPSPSWFQVDCDSEGAIGPTNDVFICESSASLQQTFYKMSWDGNRGGFWGRDVPANFTTSSPLDYSTNGGGGHYPWTIGIGRVQGRLITSGTADIGLYGWRILDTSYDIPSDPASLGDPVPTSANIDIYASARAWGNYTMGSLYDYGFPHIFPGTIWPFGMRPSLWGLHGCVGYGLLYGLTDTTLGPGHYNTESWDALNVQFPTDNALATFIQSGMGGSIPRPEITGDDLKDFIYMIRRCALSGSMVATVGDLPQRAVFETDVTAPVISAVSANRASTTSVTVTWTTDKPTYGGAVAGFASGHGAAFPYHMWKMEAYGGISDINLSYKTTGHSVTITGLKVSATTYVRVIAKDMAGNVSISAEQTVT